MSRKNPDLFACFYGDVELRAVLHVAVDDPRIVGEMDIFLIGTTGWDIGRFLGINAGG